MQHELPRRHGASVGEILLAACLQTLGDWSNCENVLVDLTHHGRQELFDDLSLSRTVGLLTSNVPILINLPTGASMAEAVATVHGHLGRMPRCGLSLGVLRYMTSQTECIAPLNRLPEAELKFNYLGSMMIEPSGLDRLRPVPVTFAGVLDPLEPRAYLHNLELALVGDRLHVEWKYNAEAHREQTIRRLISDFIQSLRDLIHPGNAKARSGAVAGGSGGPR